VLANELPRQIKTCVIKSTQLILNSSLFGLTANRATNDASVSFATRPEQTTGTHQCGS
jgi:hypothetical protein